MVPLKSSLTPRKKPVQARSASTVEAIFDAAIQVLIDRGPEHLTTSRVAERAGVSVGSLYQYFPNKQALLAAVLERHLTRVVVSVEQACERAKGQPLATMAHALVDAFVDAKFAEPAASRALYAVAAEVGGTEVVARLTHRSQLMLCEMLATSPSCRFDQLAAISYVLSTSVIGPIQGLLVADAKPEVILVVRTQLKLMATAYLERVSLP